MIEQKVLNKEGCEGEVRAFFVKMVGDYYRYIAEVAEGEKLEAAKIKAQQAFDEMQANFHPCNPIGLGINLSLSVFQYEVMKNK